jgi:hypothetical protein
VIVRAAAATQPTKILAISPSDRPPVSLFSRSVAYDATSDADRESHDERSLPELSKSRLTLGSVETLVAFEQGLDSIKSLAAAKVTSAHV